MDRWKPSQNQRSACPRPVRSSWAEKRRHLQQTDPSRQRLGDRRRAGTGGTGQHESALLLRSVKSRSAGPGRPPEGAGPRRSPTARRARPGTLSRSASTSARSDGRSRSTSRQSGSVVRTRVLLPDCLGPYTRTAGRVLSRRDKAEAWSRGPFSWLYYLTKTSILQAYISIARTGRRPVFLREPAELPPLDEQPTERRSTNSAPRILVSVNGEAPQWSSAYPHT